MRSGPRRVRSPLRRARAFRGRSGAGLGAIAARRPGGAQDPRRDVRPDGRRWTRTPTLFARRSHEADPDAVITGLDAIDLELRAALDHDLYLVGGAALIAVALGLRVALRSARHALIALATLACEIGVVGVAMRALAVRWHVYDALVLPVLFGITIDESMFLLTAARGRSTADAMRDQAPLVASTALTTAAGFVALTVCRFSGLRDLGLVAAIGVLAGLAAALVIVPSALKLASSN